MASNATAILPALIFSGSSCKPIVFINLFLDAPSNIGHPKLWKILSPLIKVKLCSKVFAKPMPGSTIIFFLGIPI